MGKSSLAGAVGRAQRRGAQPRDRRNVDDRAAAVLAHQRHRRLRAQKWSRQVDSKHTFPVGVRSLHHRCEDRDPGIVDQRIEPSEAALDLGKCGSDRIGVGHVAGQGQRGVGFVEARHAFFQDVAENIEQRHAPAFGKKAFGHGKPDATGRTRNQGDFVRGRGHGCSVLTFIVLHSVLSLAWKPELCFVAPANEDHRAEETTK